MIVIARRASPDVAISSKPTIDNVDSMIVIARRASPDVAIPSQPTRDNVHSVLPVRRFFTSFRMTAYSVNIVNDIANC